MTRLKAELAETLSANERVRAETEAARLARESAEERARREADERARWEELARPKRQNKPLPRSYGALQDAAVQAPAQQKAATLREAEEAAKAIIDCQLRERGWEADSETLRYTKGARPAKGKAMADHPRSRPQRLGADRTLQLSAVHLHPPGDAAAGEEA